MSVSRCARVLSGLLISSALVAAAPRADAAQCFGTSQGNDPRWSPEQLTYTPAPGATWERRTLGVIERGGGLVEREYWYFVPPTAPASNRVLLVVLHGGGSGYRPDEQAFVAEWGFNRIASLRGWTVVYPGGSFDPDELGCASGRVARHWNDGRFFSPEQPSLYAAEQDVDDVSFIADLVAEQVASFGVDGSRVYAVGASNGGMMVHRLLGEPLTAGLFAAVATNIATLPAASADPTDPRFAPLEPVHALHLFGNADTVIPDEGGAIFAQPVIVDTVGGCGSDPSNCDKGIPFDNGVGLGFGTARSTMIARYESANFVTTYTIGTFPDIDGDGLLMYYGRSSNPGRLADLELYAMDGGGHRNWGQSPSGALGETCVFKPECDNQRVNKTRLATSSFDVCWPEIVGDFFASH